MSRVKSYFDPKEVLLEKIRQRGGWVNAHAHIDRDYTLREQDFKNGLEILHSLKWDLNDQFKRDASVDEIYSRMARSLENMCKQNVQAVASFIDVDPVVKDKAIKAADKARSAFKDSINIRFVNQVIKGLLDPEAQQWFEVGAQFVDIIGGIPEKDSDHKEENFDILFSTAKRLGKSLHIHVDQLNDPTQRETEMLVKKTMDYEYQGKVTAIHAVSVAAQPRDYRLKLYQSMVEAGVMVVCCPSAWIDHRRNETLVPSHNSITPVDEMVEAGVVVAIGTDNVRELHLPFNDGDMWTELQTLLKANRFYNLDALADIASINGLKVLGIEL